MLLKKIVITPEQVKNARKSAGLTQAQAASVIHADVSRWGGYECGARNMPFVVFDYFLIKTKQKSITETE